MLYQCSMKQTYSTSPSAVSNFVPEDLNCIMLDIDQDVGVYRNHVLTFLLVVEAQEYLLQTQGLSLQVLNSLGQPLDDETGGHSHSIEAVF